MSMSSVMSMSISSVMKKGLMEWASEVVSVVASEYNLDKEKCMSLIESTWETGVIVSTSVVSSKSAVVSSKGKRLIPMPFNRETVDLNGCHGLNYNHGLFTQCKNIKLEEETYCNICKSETETSSSGKPLCGTIEDRTDPEFKDSENRKPVHYLSVLRKLRVKPEAAIEAAGKQNISIDSFHLQDIPKPAKVVKEKVIKEKPVKEPKPVKEKVIKEKPVKEPKPVKEKVIKEKPVKEPKPVKEKVIKEKPVKEKKEAVGRPKSTKKPIETAAVEDLFASLVAEELSNGSGSESESESEKETKKNTEKELNEMFVTLFDEEVVEKQEKEKSNKVDKKDKKDKRSESDSERKERNPMQNEEKEQKLKETAASKEQKLKEAADAKEKKLKEAADAKEKKLKEAADAKEKKLKEAVEAKEKKLKEAAEAKLEKEAALAAEKEKKAQEAAEKKAQKKQKEVAAPETTKKVEEPVEVTKVTVKRITIDGKEYLKSSTNMLYDPKSKDEVGIYNSETGGIDALPEESDDEEEVEDDYDSEDN